MKLLEKYPVDESLKKFVEKYQLFEATEPAYFKSIPNNKLECWFLISGEFEIFDVNKQSFVQARKLGAYPATNTPLLFKLEKPSLVLNIKFNLTALMFKEFSALYPPRLDFDLREIFPSSMIAEFAKLNIKSDHLDGKQIEKWLSALPESLTLHDPVICDFIESVENSNGDIDKILEQFNFSAKTLERWSKKYFGLSPKKLFSIHRLNSATQFAKENEFGKLIDLIEVGYYDQSHFIRECKRITGLTPSALFKNMSLPTNDLIVGKTVI